MATIFRRVRKLKTDGLNRRRSRELKGKERSAGRGSTDCSIRIGISLFAVERRDQYEERFENFRDSDMHVYDPADLYVKYMNPKWGERMGFRAFHS